MIIAGIGSASTYLLLNAKDPAHPTVDEKDEAETFKENAEDLRAEWDYNNGNSCNAVCKWQKQQEDEAGSKAEEEANNA